MKITDTRQTTRVARTLLADHWMPKKRFGKAIAQVVGSTVLIAALLSCRGASLTRPAFLNPASLNAPPGYSHVVEVPPGSRLIFVSGQIAVDSAGRVVGAGDFRAQTVQVFENLSRALAASGASFADVVKLNFYVVDVSHLVTLREVRDKYVNTASPPASTLVEIRRLARDDFLIEVEAVAVARRR